MHNAYNKNVRNEEQDFANESTLIEYIQAQHETHWNGKCMVVQYCTIAVTLLLSSMYK